MSSGTRKYIQHIDCVHKQHLANQGMTFCFKGDVTKCDECQFKEPKDVEVIESWASTDDEITYADTND